MEFEFYLLSVLMILFILLGVYDGFYLHIFKYRLYDRLESRFEHQTHTWRAILFPLIILTLYLGKTPGIFVAGLVFVSVDLLVLVMDAYSEKDSRAFMGGLPRWEYIVHLFVNGFHFSSVFLFVSLRINWNQSTFEFQKELNGLEIYQVFSNVMQFILPGAVLLAVIHVVTCFKMTIVYWNALRNRITCC